MFISYIGLKNNPPLIIFIMKNFHMQGGHVLISQDKLGVFKIVISVIFSYIWLLFSAKSLVAQLTSLGIYNWDIRGSNLLSPHCNYLIIF